jgi:hypothetical protein
MRYPARNLFFVATVLFLGSGTPTSADVRLVYREALPSGARTLTVLVQDGRAAFLRGDPAAPAAVEAIYDRRRQAFVFINHDDRVYTVLSREWAEEMRKRLEETGERMVEDIKRQAATMPPDLRPFYLQAQAASPWMSAFLQSATAPGAGQSRQYVAETGSHELGKFRCRPGVLRQAGKKTHDLCLSDYDVLGIAPQDAETLRQMRSDALELHKLGAFMFGFTAPGLARIGPEADGLPVQFADVAGGGPTTTLESLAADKAPAEAFDLAPEYLEAVIPLPGTFD